jgi:hypothetical protein
MYAVAASDAECCGRPCMASCTSSTDKVLASGADA